MHNKHQAPLRVTATIHPVEDKELYELLVHTKHRERAKRVRALMRAGATLAGGRVVAAPIEPQAPAAEPAKHVAPAPVSGLAARGFDPATFSMSSGQ